MLNEKGFYSTSTIIVTLLISVMLISLFTSPIINTKIAVKDLSTQQDNYVKTINARERLYSKLKENPSIKGAVRFQDIDREFNIRELSLEHRKVEIIGNNIDLNIKNKTDINIDVSLFGKSNSVSTFNLVTDGVLYKDLNYSYKDIQGIAHKEIKIPAEKIYDDKLDKTSYGVTNMYLTGDSLLTVNYDVIENRKIEITSKDGDKEEVNIQIDIDNNVIVKK